MFAYKNTNFIVLNAARNVDSVASVYTIVFQLMYPRVGHERIGSVLRTQR